MYDFAKEMYFDEKALGSKSTRDKAFIRLLKSFGIMVSASGVSTFYKKKLSNTIFLSTDPNEFCDRLKVSIQEKQTGKISDLINEEVIAIADKLLEYKCISTKQHKILLHECLN